ncbi:hypothetical protein [Novosphingobium barchaimii]|uniref:hypothetical protein n=1 Tax=Novosphingobium barchaimii TaxID=1420591 RepID=UPI000AA8A32C|nr:hypothetical protein [Novosphingobium barchaimii]
MARRHDRQARDFSPGPSSGQSKIPRETEANVANDNCQLGQSYPSALPPDARAITEPAPVAVNQASRAGAEGWRLRFAARWGPRPIP